MESRADVPQRAFVKTDLLISPISLKKSQGTSILNTWDVFMPQKAASSFLPSPLPPGSVYEHGLQISQGTGHGQSHWFKPCVDLNISSVVPRIVSFIWLNPSYIISVSDEVPSIVGSSANSCKGNALKHLQKINPGLSVHCRRNTYSSSGGPLSLEFLWSNRVLV